MGHSVSARHSGLDPRLLRRAAELVEALGDRAAAEDAAYTAGFRTGYGHGYAIGHAHGYDRAEDQAASAWTTAVAQLRRLRQADERSVEHQVSGAVSAAEREALVLAWRHWDAFTARARRNGGGRR